MLYYEARIVTVMHIRDGFTGSVAHPARAPAASARVDTARSARRYGRADPRECSLRDRRRALRSRHIGGSQWRHGPRLPASLSVVFRPGRDGTTDRRTPRFSTSRSTGTGRPLRRASKRSARLWAFEHHVARRPSRARRITGRGLRHAEANPPATRRGAGSVSATRKRELATVTVDPKYAVTHPTALSGGCVIDVLGGLTADARRRPKSPTRGGVVETSPKARRVCRNPAAPNVATVVAITVSRRARAIRVESPPRVGDPDACYLLRQKVTIPSGKSWR